MMKRLHHVESKYVEIFTFMQSPIVKDSKTKVSTIYRSNSVFQQMEAFYPLTVLFVGACQLQIICEQPAPVDLSAVTINP
jgi:hypothetical protein